jgi:hypothetical protein
VRHRDCAALFARLAGLVLVVHTNLVFTLSLINDGSARGGTSDILCYTDDSDVVL